ncbi:unnamed protein product [Phyllotreta striolata]|uniref:Fibronectin type-III domain-containing protein n=1 Tax=Phyllotreta striolata TaxID=444603 RepID=A0A9N9XU97_PHYSR|nr:unnamed protein product [Phyllotreta striolata]
MNPAEVNEIIKAANLYLTRLKYLNNELDSAVKQIEHTFVDSEADIKKNFAKIRESLNDVISKREQHLLDKARRTKSDALAPLRECQSFLLGKIETTVKLIQTGTTLVTNRDIKEFNNNANVLGCLPEVPELKDVPYLSFYYDPALELELIDKIGSFGDIYKHPPVQIHEMIEKPGAILVEWKITVDNEEKVTDIEEFKLQKAFGDVTKDKRLIANFSECFRGLDSQYLVKDLEHNQAYSFRVCCRFEGSKEWSPWSLPQIASTSLKHFTWKYNSNYEYSNQYRAAQPKGDKEDMLCSDGAQFSVGHSIDFMFLESDSNYAVVGLLVPSGDLPKSLKDIKESSFLMNNHGKIIVDGVEKATVLPEFHRGSKVTFSCCLTNGKNVRVSIDSEDKRVTYDWPVNVASKMYFVGEFHSSNWKVMVE